jgi:hypothetical protein
MAPDVAAILFSGSGSNSGQIWLLEVTLPTWSAAQRPPPPYTSPRLQAIRQQRIRTNTGILVEHHAMRAETLLRPSLPEGLAAAARDEDRTNAAAAVAYLVGAGVEVERGTESRTPRTACVSTSRTHTTPVRTTTPFARDRRSLHAPNASQVLR